MISKRLQFIIDIMDKFDTVADIGTDHGYVSVGLIKSGKANKVVASDISNPSLQKAVDYVKLNNLEEKIQTRVGNGLDVLKVDEVDAVVIAGMGGVLISDILDKNYRTKFINKVPILVLQPVQQAKNLRYYLYENRYDILNEYIIQDMGKNYDIIIAKKNESISNDYLNLTENIDIFMEFGIINIKKKDELLKNIIRDKIDKTKKLLNNLQMKSIKNEKIDELVKRIRGLESIYETI